MKAQIEVRVVLVLTMEIDNVRKSVFELSQQAEQIVTRRLENIFKEHDDMQLLSPTSKLKVQE